MHLTLLWWYLVILKPTFLLVLFQILGLDICANTMVGDNMHRGISGGQKKRVTTGIDLKLWLLLIAVKTMKWCVVDSYGWNSCCRGDDCRTNRCSVYGRNLNGSRQLNDIPDREMPTPVVSCDGIHHLHVTVATCSGDVWALWRRGAVVWGSSCLSRTSRAHSGVFWGVWVSVSREEGNCWLLTRGRQPLSISFL